MKKQKLAADLIVCPLASGAAPPQYDGPDAVRRVIHGTSGYTGRVGYFQARVFERRHGTSGRHSRCCDGCAAGIGVESNGVSIEV